ncbi:MAG: phosphoenolpyruvate--protein phosphotransferase [Nitriliruptoraceae bacterium]
MTSAEGESVAGDGPLRITGRGASSGIAMGPVHLLDRVAAASSPSASPTPDAGDDHAGEDHAGEDQGEAQAAEVERLLAALDAAGRNLRALADRVGGEVGADEADIFATQASFTEDPVLRRRAQALIKEGQHADAAVASVFGEFRQRLAESDDELLAARVSDIDDVSSRVQALLDGVTAGVAAPDVASIIVADELTPSQTVELPRDSILALVTERGSPTSHAAILSRALGVPCVVGAPGVVEAAGQSQQAVVDGASGEVTFDPDEQMVTEIERQIERAEREKADLARFAARSTQTADGHRIEIAANIASHDDLRSAREVGAEGSGLVRTELLYLDRKDAPSIDEQRDFVVEVLEAFPSHRVVVRTLDVGADKPLPFVATRDEPNPALGVRGLRLSLAEPKLLKDQFAALLQAAHQTSGDRAGGDQCSPADQAGRLCVMLPMVTERAELIAARKIFDDVRTSTGLDDVPVEFGIMVETPVAALGIGSLVDLCDFVSIGTNDLVQYLFAADRLNADVEVGADVLHPVVLDVIAGVAQAAHAVDAWVGVCGEAASDPLVAQALVGLGVDELSMTPAAILSVRSALAGMTVADCRVAVDQARTMSDGRQARAALAEILDAEGAGTG